MVVLTPIERENLHVFFNIYFTDLSRLCGRRHLATKVGMSKGGGKQWQTTPKNLLWMQCARAITVTWLGSGSCQARHSRPNTNEWISQMFNVYTFGNTADIYAIVHLVPHTCQHITVDQSHGSGDTVGKIWRLAESGGTKTVSFTNRQKKKSHGVKSGDRCGHRINASSSFPVCPIHLCGKFRLRYPRTSL